MPTITRQPRTMQVRGDFVLLGADSLRLLLPQHDVNLSEYLDRTPSPTGSIGIFTLGAVDGQQKQVAALSDRMKVMEVFPKNRFLLTRLNGSHELLLAWTEVRVMMGVSLEFHPIPPVLAGRAGLIDAYVLLEDGAVAFCTTASRVLAEAQIGECPSPQESDAVT